MGIDSSRMVVSRLPELDLRNELMPLSDKARLIDFVKLRGTVTGSRRSRSSLDMKIESNWIEQEKGESVSRKSMSYSLLLTSSQLINLDMVTSLGSV